MDEIKNYMKHANQVRHDMRVDEHAVSNQTKNAEKRQVRFLVDDINRLLLDLENELSLQFHDVADEEIIIRIGGLSEM